MKITTLSYLVKEGEVLLALKKRGFGEGRWNGVGGKLKENEKIPVAAAREIKEEIGVDVSLEDLTYIGTLAFIFFKNPDWDQISHVYIVRRWQGEPSESEEMKPQWYPISALPFENMWIDDPYWLPEVLAGKSVDAKFLFDKQGGALLDFKVTFSPSY